MTSKKVVVMDPAEYMALSLLVAVTQSIEHNKNKRPTKLDREVIETVMPFIPRGFQDVANALIGKKVTNPEAVKGANMLRETSRQVEKEEREWERLIKMRRR